MPLDIPDGFKSYNMVSVDPGLNRTGVSVYEIDMMSKKVVGITAFTLVNEHLENTIEFEEDYHPERVFKLYRLKNAFSNVIRTYNPVVVACESPFYSSFRPSAYASLVEVISHLHDCVITHNHNTLFRTIEPMVVKKTIGAAMSSDKGSVKEAILRNPLILPVLKVSLDSLDEHAIDSIAIGYTFIKNNGEMNLC
jgi:Holliday junction resolvasome RuvABC endonuclease subunit